MTEWTRRNRREKKKKMERFNVVFGLWVSSDKTIKKRKA